MIKKIKNSIFLAFLFFLCFSSFVNVQAAGIDTDSTVGSIDLTCKYDNYYVNDTAVSIYRVASVDALGSYSFVSQFFDRSENLDILTSSQLKNLAKELDKFVAEKGISPLLQYKTSEVGRVEFTGLVPGLYLVLTEDKVVDSKQYITSPLLVSVPTKGEDGEYHYKVSIDQKTQMNDLSHDTDGDNTTDSPSTYDAIVIYVIIFTICIIGIIGLVCYIYLKKRKDVEKNEK